MGREIERKFLVRGDGWRSGSSGAPLRQGYLCTDPGRVVRVRLFGSRGYITVKGKSSGAARDEFEYPIPPADAARMMERLALRPIIEKTRYTTVFGKRTWVIDVFEGENSGLILAEVELEREGDAVELPEWAGEEVTGDRRYENASLVADPYHKWRPGK